MFPVGRILNTNVFQINLGQLLFRATLKVTLGSCLSPLSKWTTLTAPKSNVALLLYIRLVKIDCVWNRAVTDTRGRGGASNACFHL